MAATAQYAALLSTLSVVGTSPSFAADRACSPIPVETDPLVRERWPDLPARISGALDGRDDFDACARITIRLNRETIVVTVVLPDGRSTSRLVSRRQDLLPTLEALLLLPAADPQPREAEAVRPAKPVEPGRAELTARDPLPGPVVSAGYESVAPHLGRSRLEFSLAIGARAGDGQAGASLGALTFFDIGGWLLGFEGAADQYQRVDGTVGAAGLELALLGGRRFRFEHTAIDLTAGPAVALPGVGSSVSTQAGSGGAMPPPTSDGPRARLLGGARLTFRTHSFVRTFAGVDGELALRPSATGPAMGEPQLPGWLVGVVLGATVGTP